MLTFLPQSATGRMIFALGAVALPMGIWGLLQPEVQLHMMGFGALTPSNPDAQAALMSIISLATINTALLYLFGSIREWPAFPLFASVSRLLMGNGLLVLALTGKGPAAFVDAAIWEGIGVLLIGAAYWRDKRKRHGSGLAR